MKETAPGHAPGLLATQWKSFLSEEGYRPCIVVNEEEPRYASVRFKADGRRFAAMVDEQDPTFLHLDLGYEIDDTVSAPALLETANALNSTLKVVKVTVEIAEHLVHFQAEIFSEGLPSSDAFERILGQLKLAADQLMERLAEERPRAMA